MTTMIRSGRHSVVGIDLGTTYSAVAVYDWDNERSEILLTEQQQDTVPSVVGWDPVNQRVIVGDVAKRNMAARPGTTIAEIKREMGALFDDDSLKLFDPDHRSGLNAGDPLRVSFCGNWYRPQEISAFTLMRMKEVAERHLGAEIFDAVITVPAYFTEKQRKATEEAARLAGLYPRQLIPEPTAAAICYGVDKGESTRQIYLVYDLGGGTFDVSIIVVTGDRIEVVATAGDRRLGGVDFDNAITAWAITKLKTEHDLDITRDRGAQAIVKFHSERLKKQLSIYQQAEIPLLELRPSRPPKLTLTRVEFEAMILSLVRKSLNCVDTALQAAHESQQIERKDINAVLLVGGSSKIPMVKRLLAEHFQKPDSFVRSDLNPDQVVARGAAVLARKFEPTPGPFDITRKIDDSKVSSDVADEIYLIAEHSLGIEVDDDDFAEIISQGRQLPIAVTRGGFVNGGPCTHLPVRVYQGEDKKVYKNELIGVVPLGPMEPRPQGQHQFEVTFSLDKNGLMSAVVHHINENQRYAGTFDQPISVGGPKALEVSRKQLVLMWGTRGGRHDEVPPPPPPPAPIAAPPASPPAPAVASSAPLPPPPMPPPPVPPPPAPPPPAPAPTATASASAAPAPLSPAPLPPASLPPAPLPPAPLPLAGLREPRVAVPEQFKSIVRRVRKRLLIGEHAPLRNAYLEFVDALDVGAATPQVEELGDRLEDMYQDARA